VLISEGRHFDQVTQFSKAESSWPKAYYKQRQMIAFMYSNHDVNHLVKLNPACKVTDIRVASTDENSGEPDVELRHSIATI